MGKACRLFIAHSMGKWVPTLTHKTQIALKIGAGRSVVSFVRKKDEMKSLFVPSKLFSRVLKFATKAGPCPPLGYAVGLLLEHIKLA